jgi:hypothetical protein
MWKSNKETGERVKRPLVRLAQPVVVVEKPPIPVDVHRKTKVVLVSRQRFFTPPDVVADPAKSGMKKGVKSNPCMFVIPVYDRDCLRRQIHKNMNSSDYSEPAECLSLSSKSRRIRL